MMGTLTPLQETLHVAPKQVPSVNVVFPIVLGRSDQFRKPIPKTVPCRILRQPLADHPVVQPKLRQQPVFGGFGFERGRELSKRSDLKNPRTSGLNIPSPRFGVVRGTDQDRPLLSFGTESVQIIQPRHGFFLLPLQHSTYPCTMQTCLQCKQEKKIDRSRGVPRIVFTRMAANLQQGTRGCSALILEGILNV